MNGPPIDRIPLQSNADNATGYIGGTHFHGAITVNANPTSDGEDLQRGYADLLRRQEAIISRRLTGPLSNPATVESALLGSWRQWRNSAEWYDRLVSACNDLATLPPSAGRSNALQSLVEWHNSIMCDRRSVSTLLLAMRRLELEAVGASLHQRLSKTEGESARKRISRAISSCRWLIRSAAQPDFASIFAVSGQFGSGKSRLLTSIANAANASGDLALLIDLRPDQSLGTAIRQYIAETTGILVERFQDLRRLADAGPNNCQVFIIMDNVDNWARLRTSALDEMQSLIDTATETGRIRWVIAADANGLDALSGADGYFWVFHGYSRHQPGQPDRYAPNHKTGWIDLDAANRDQLLGFRILRTQSDADDPDLDVIIGDSDAFTHEISHLSNPLPAWVRLDSRNKALLLGEGHQPLTDVNSIDFVRDYWAWVRRKVSNNERTRINGLDRVMRVLAANLVNQPGSQVLIDASTAATHEIALDDLTASGLVTCEWIGDPEIEDLALRVTFTFPALLAYRAARTILPSSSVAPVESSDFESWWGLAGRGLGLAESVCQFALMLSAPLAEPPTASFWATWTRNPKSPKAPLFMAAFACGTQAVNMAANYVPRAHKGSKRELFIITRFVGKAPSAEWTVELRLRSLRPLVAQICAEGLEVYLQQALVSLLAQVTERNYLKVCLELDGYVGESILHLLADHMAWVGSRIFEGRESDWIFVVLRFCRKRSAMTAPPQVRPHNKRARSSRAGEPRLPRRSFDPKNSFAAHLTTAVSGFMVRRYGSDGCRMLARMGWWTAVNSSVDAALAAYMQQKLTTQLGSTVHHGNTPTGGWTKYEGVLHDLLNGSLLNNGVDSWVIAYYLLKHSAPTYGRADVQIPARLHKFLVEIRRRPQIVATVGPEVEIFLRANGIAGLPTKGGMRRVVRWRKRLSDPDR